MWADDNPGSFLQSPYEAGAATEPQPLNENPLGSMIGPYKLREQIGEGGVGVVYVAEQTEPIRRKVALKIIKPGMDTREVVRPVRGRTSGAGADGPSQHRHESSMPGPPTQGRPYFVMELVQGAADHRVLRQQQARL